MTRPKPRAREIIHRCPRKGEAVTPCCKRTPFELPRTDRMTTAPSLVTCKPRARTRVVKAFGLACLCHGWLVGEVERTRKAAQERVRIAARWKTGARRFTVVPLTGVVTLKQERGK